MKEGDDENEERTVDFLQDTLHNGKSSGLRKEGEHLAEEPLCVKVDREVLKTEKGPMMQFPTTIHPHSQRALNIDLKPALTPTWKPRKKHGPRVFYCDVFGAPLVTEFIVNSYKDAGEQLWYTAAGASVICDQCQKGVPQEMGSLQNDPTRSKNSQCLFLCFDCLDAGDHFRKPDQFLEVESGTEGSSCLVPAKVCESPEKDDGTLVGQHPNALKERIVRKLKRMWDPKRLEKKLDRIRRDIMTGSGSREETSRITPAMLKSMVDDLLEKLDNEHELRARYEWPSETPSTPKRKKKEVEASSTAKRPRIQ